MKKPKEENAVKILGNIFNVSNCNLKKKKNSFKNLKIKINKILKKHNEPTNINLLQLTMPSL